MLGSVTAAEERPHVALRRVALTDASVAPLLSGLAEEYAVRYGAIDEMSRTEGPEFDPPSGAFFVAVGDGETVAGGGFRRISDEVCEIKRVWTSAGHRRRGLAGQVLSALETAAEAAGYQTIRLETGPRQPEAEAFYLGRGYRRIPVYGRYELALAFERSIDAP
jgi:GNAT superfamily N-acetyltransferase